MTNNNALVRWKNEGVGDIPTENLIELLDEIFNELKKRRDEENSK